MKMCFHCRVLSLVLLFAVDAAWCAQAAAPTISSVSPISGPIGQAVTISGANFSTVAADNVVYFGAVRATVTAAAADSLTVTVPTGATYAPITVTVGGLTAYSTALYGVTFSSAGIIDSTSFTSPVAFPGGNAPIWLAIGDLDGDGKTDIIVPNINANTVSIFRNTSTPGVIDAGSFAARIDLTTGATPTGVAVGDLDGDGRLDLVVANNAAGTISVFRNISSPGSLTTASFAAKVDFTTGLNAQGVAIGDLDGDGKPDIVCVNAGNNTISILRNHSTPGTLTSASFGPKVDFASSSSPLSPAIGDIDGDGKPEIVIISIGSSVASVYRNQSSAGVINSSSFASRVDFATGANPQDVVIGDLDGDGKPDLAVVNYGGRTISLLRNTSTLGAITSSSFAAKVDLTAGADARGIALGDLDGDGKPDMAEVNAPDNTVSVFLNTSTAGSLTTSSFAPRVNYSSLPGNGPVVFAIADLDGDGRPDLVAGNLSSASITIWRNNTPSSSIPPSFTSHPQSQTVDAGGSATFAATVTGSIPLHYQWRYNDVDIDGAMESSFTLSNVQTNQSGYYSVRVSNANGSITSSNAVLVVLPDDLAKVVVPTGYANTDGNGGSALLRQVGREQLIYAASMLPSTPIIVHEIRLRPSAVFGSAFATNSVNLQINLSTTTIQPANWSGTFANNHGANNTEVFHGTIGLFSTFTGPLGGAKQFDIIIPLSTPFLYDPAVGNLVVDFRNYSGSLATWVDARGAGGPGAVRLLGGSPDALVASGADTGADILQLRYATVPLPPSIETQPVDQTAFVGSNATFTVTARGSSPLTYQWRFNDADIPGATDATLVLNNVQLGDAGMYSVLVSNALDSVTSSKVSLGVKVPKAYDFQRDFSVSANPSGAWSYGYKNTLGGALTLFSYSTSDPGSPWERWSRFSNFFSAVYHNGSPNTVFSDGGQGVFPPGTIWFYPGGDNASDNFGVIRLTLPTGTLGTYRLEVKVDNAYNGPSSGDTDFHVLKNNSEIFGEFLPPNTGTNHDRTITLAAGDTLDFAVGRGNDGHLAGSGLKIQVTLESVTSDPYPPVILGQPSGKTVTVGDSVTFGIGVDGSFPLSYQWRFNGADITDETNATLTLSNIQHTQAGNYSVVVSNALNSVTSEDAALIVNFPTAKIRAANVNAASGGEVNVPVELGANGNENALGFSLNFNPALLTFEDATLGGGTPDGASLVVNSIDAVSGKLGFLLSLAADSTFSEGTQQIVVVKFSVAPVLNPASSPITFGDAPTVRQLSDKQAHVLPSAFVPGSVSVTSVAFEGDVAIRPNGDKALTVIDWVQVGRFVAGLDTIDSPDEYQRADCAPRATRGNGVISITDWVQAGRYAAGLDPLTPAGGPTADVPEGGAPPSLQSLNDRTLCLMDTNIPQGQTNTVSVRLLAQGDENAVGFSVVFDPAKLSFLGASAGADAHGATFNVNTLQAGAGRIGVALALPTDHTLIAGTQEVAVLQFAAAAVAPASVSLSFGNAPVHREISDAQANALVSDYSPGTVSVIVPPPVGPTLGYSLAGSTLTLYWPAPATGFDLESSAVVSGGTWDKVAITPIELFGQKIVPVPVGTGQKFFRLKKQ